jgi:peptidoglycan/LPS O-acetylase OafA/YrhL
LSSFFIISGLFVFRSADRLRGRPNGWRDFYVNRLLRVGPAVWAYLVVTVVLVVAIGAASISDLPTVPGVGWIASTVLLAPVYSPGFLEDYGVGTVNGSLPTVAVEVGSTF